MKQLCKSLHCMNSPVAQPVEASKPSLLFVFDPFKDTLPSPTQSRPRGLLQRTSENQLPLSNFLYIQLVIGVLHRGLSLCLQGCHYGAPKMLPSVANQGSRSISSTHRLCARSDDTRDDYHTFYGLFCFLNVVV